MAHLKVQYVIVFTSVKARFFTLCTGVKNLQKRDLGIELDLEEFLPGGISGLYEK